MRHFKILLAVSIVFCSILLISSCNKEESNTPNAKIEFRSRDFSSERNIKQYVSTDSRHALVAKTISVWFKSTAVRTAFDAHIITQGNNVVLLSDFLYIKVLDDVNLLNTYPTSVGTTVSISLCDLINEYLKDYPGLEISFIKDSDTEYPDIINDGNFETVSVYSDIDTFPVYKDGNLIGSYSVSDEPTDKTILKLQTSDIYDVINTNDIHSNNSNYKYADLLDCSLLKDMINNLPFISSETKLVNGCILKNPLGETKVLTLEYLFNYYNTNCGNFSSPPPPNNPPTGPTVPPCAADRDDLVNGREIIIDIKCPNGKDILRSCDKWCSYWNKNCEFQVDVFIPVLVASGQEFTTLGSLKKVFNANEKKLRQKKLVSVNVPITEWLFLEGKHGDEWQYTWTGRHRKRGTTSETTVGFGFSSKITFKVGDVGVEVGPTASISHKILRANKDCELGTEIARYCRPLAEFMSLGDIEYHVNEQ